MFLLATLQRSGGIEGLARQAEVSVDRVNPLCERLLPLLMVAMRNYVRSHGGGIAGVHSLMTLIDDCGDGGLAAAVLGEPGVCVAAGETLLAAFFAGRDERDRQIARQLDQAPEEAADPVLVSRLFPLLAMLVAGYMAAQVGGSGAQGSGGIESLGPLLTFLLADADDKSGTAQIETGGG